MSTLHSLGEPFKKMTEYLTKTKTKYVEIIDGGIHTLNKRRVLTLKTIGESYDLKYSVHAPFEDINIASPSKPLLKAMVKRLEKSIAYSNSLNAYMWIFHPGLRTGVSWFYPNMDWLQNLKTTELLFRIADDYGVKIAVENVPEPYPFLMKNVAEFLKFYNEVKEQIDLVLDIGHAHINGQTELFLKTFADKIVHIHAHDNDGKNDQHLGISCGTVDWANVANILKRTFYDKVVIVESIYRTEESMQKLKETLA